MYSHLVLRSLDLVLTGTRTKLDERERIASFGGEAEGGIAERERAPIDFIGQSGSAYPDQMGGLT